jgi:hypothetical protein
MSILTHRLRHLALAVAGGAVCSLSLVALAQAGLVSNRAALHKRHLQQEPYFGRLSGVAAAWVSGQCDRPLQSELPPCIYPTFPAGSPYYYEGWPYYRSGWRRGPSLSDK